MPLLIAMISSILFIGCFNDNYSDCTSLDELSQMDAYITLTISTTSEDVDTRTNPNGGLDGDGREYGINNESKIYNLTLFLYTTPDVDGINNNSNPQIYSMFIDNINFSGTAANNFTYRSPVMQIKNFTITENTRLVVLANGGDWTEKSIHNLNELRNYLNYDDAYTTAPSISNYDSFVMVSSKINNFIVKENGKTLGTQGDPIRASSTIERLASRIDIVPNAALNSSYYEYEVDNGTTDKVRATHITPFNLWKSTSGQYLLKRVSESGATSDIVILGDESPVSGIQTNYVVSPYMLLQSGVQKTVSYYTSNATAVEGWYSNHINKTIVPKAVTSVTNADADGKSYYILDYAQENTMLKDNQVNCFTTGILVQATYVPQVVYATDGTTVVSYTVGSDLWLLNGKFYNQAITGAVKYTDGVCYYRYYIRHSNDNILGVVSKMEYGIVRNNIYRLVINSFQKIGDPTPVPNNLTDMDEYLRIHLYVQPWELRVHPEIIM